MVSGRAGLSRPTIFTSNLIEWVREFINHTLLLCFVDLKAYDSVNHDALWTVLQERYHV